MTQFSLDNKKFILSSRNSGQWLVLSYLISITGSGPTVECSITSVDFTLDGQPTG